MVNLSRLAEELILWSTPEFGYLELDDLFASTSSIMPQKKNPDTAELARGKTGSVLGCLVSALAICKALPQSYNRDLQEVTPHLWQGMDWTRSTVRILDGCVSTLKFNLERLEASSGQGFSTATELADSLVRRTGMPFRTAHSIVGRIAAAGKNPHWRIWMQHLCSWQAFASVSAAFLQTIWRGPWTPGAMWPCGPIQAALRPLKGCAWSKRAESDRARSAEVAKRCDMVNHTLAELREMK